MLRGRAASYLTLQSPAGELDDTACGGSGWGISFCSGDADWLAVAAGGELGLRLEHREWMGSVTLAVGGELTASGTGYLATFEHVREGGSVGGAALVFVDWLIRDRWGIGVEAGARIEAGIGSPDRAAVHGGLRITLRP